jgi:hypothetical protein
MKQERRIHHNSGCGNAEEWKEERGDLEVVDVEVKMKHPFRGRTSQVRSGTEYVPGKLRPALRCAGIVFFHASRKLHLAAQGRCHNVAGAQLRLSSPRTDNWKSRMAQPGFEFLPCFDAHKRSSCADNNPRPKYVIA